MGKTYRNTSAYESWAKKNDSKYAKRILRRQDGSVHSFFCGSANEDVLDSFDDFGGGGQAAKRFANKQIRKYHKNSIKKMSFDDDY